MKIPLILVAISFALLSCATPSQSPPPPSRITLQDSPVRKPIRRSYSPPSRKTIKEKPVDPLPPITVIEPAPTESAALQALSNEEYSNDKIEDKTDDLDLMDAEVSIDDSDMSLEIRW